MVNRWSRPTLYNLTSELIWPEAISRAKSHPKEISWRDPTSGGTALHLSCRFQHADEVVRAMLDSQNTAACIQDNSGSTPLHIACWNGSSDVVPLLIKASPEVASTRDEEGRTPLHVACWSCPPPALETLRALIQADRDVLVVQDRYGNTPLSLLCQRYESRLRLAMESVDRGMESGHIYHKILGTFWRQLCYLLDAIAGNRSGWKLVHSLTSIPDCPRLLFDLGLKLHPEQVREQIYGSFPLHLAAKCPVSSKDDEYGDGYYVCSLLSLFPQASRVTDQVDRLPFHIAIEAGKSWDAVLRHLFETYPDAIARRDGKHHLLPGMLAALPTGHGDDGLSQLSNLLELLLADPSIVKPK